ncbi:MAG: hypothetical protein WCX20_00465 [Candidatus Shapirobacteria bacterium]
MVNKEIKDFVYKYKILLFLILLILILIILKIKYKDNSFNNNSNNGSINEPIPVIIKKYPSLDELKNMDDDSYLNYLNSLNEDELKNLPEEEPGIFYLNPFLPYEGNGFTVIKYIKENVLLVKIKNNNKETAEDELRKWLDLVEEKPGENQIVWE